MEKNEKPLARIMIAAVFIAALSIISFSVVEFLKFKEDSFDGISRDTIVVERIDTVTIVEARVDTLIRIVNRPYIVAVHDKIGRTDSVLVMLPYEQRHYSEPDVLEVWYSGIDPTIDSAVVYNRHTVEIIKDVHDIPAIPKLSAYTGLAATYDGTRLKPSVVGELGFNAKKVGLSAFGAWSGGNDYLVGARISYRIDIIR